MVNLTFAKSVDDVRGSLVSFRAAIVENPVICASLAQTAIYWVIDPDTKDFAPAKFAGFRGMDIKTYEVARTGKSSGDLFDGYQTRLVIESLAKNSSRSSKKMQRALITWLTSRLGSNAISNVKTEKWRFVELPPPARYWAFMATPDIYDIELAIKEVEQDTWIVAKSDVRKGDKAIIWKAKGKEDRRGIVALAEVLSDPQAMNETPQQMKYYKVLEREEPAKRVLIKYSVPPGLPLWLDGDETGLLSSLSVSKATGGTVFKVTPGQWSDLLSLLGDDASGPSEKVLLKEVGKSQYKDGVRVDKAFHPIFNPEDSRFYTKRGTARPIRVSFNGKAFDAEYRFEGTKAKDVDLQRIGFRTPLIEEFKKVFPHRKGFFSIKIGADLDHFIFDYQLSEDIYKERLEQDIVKSRKDGREARLKRLAEASKKPASVKVTSTAFFRNSDVIVEVLERAGGKCEECLRDAPFLRAKDKTPYLEVHHNIPLSEGGFDCVENAIAVCPNCHRRLHYG